MNLDSNETVRKNKNRPTTIVMNAVTMSNKLQCGNKRNFDVAFLSGENELSRDDRDAKKKSKETEKAEDKLEPMVNSEFFMFTFTIYLKYFISTKLLTYSLSIDIELKKARSMPYNLPIHWQLQK